MIILTTQNYYLPCTCTVLLSPFDDAIIHVLLATLTIQKVHNSSVLYVFGNCIRGHSCKDSSISYTEKYIVHKNYLQLIFVESIWSKQKEERYRIQRGNSFRDTHKDTRIWVSATPQAKPKVHGELRLLQQVAFHSSNSMCAKGLLLPAALRFCLFLASGLPDHAPTNLLGHQEDCFLVLAALVYPSQALQYISGWGPFWRQAWSHSSSFTLGSYKFTSS